MSVLCATQIILFDKHPLTYLACNKCIDHQFAVLNISIIEHWPNESLNKIQYGDENAKHRHVI